MVLRYVVTVRLKLPRLKVGSKLKMEKLTGSVQKRTKSFRCLLLASTHLMSGEATTSRSTSKVGGHLPKGALEF